MVDATARSRGSLPPAWLASVLFLWAAAALVWNVALLRTMTDDLHMNDFGKFYYSARAFLDHRDMYGPSPATEMPVSVGVGSQFLNMNPPHFHLLVLPFAVLPPSDAIGLWVALSVFALTISLLLISRELEIQWTPRLTLIASFATVAFAGTYAFFATGQLSLLLTLAMTMCWIDARHERWTRAAVWLGACASIKPFLLIFVPYLAARRQLRALAIAAVTAAVCFAIGLLVFGADAYVSWYRAVSQFSDWGYAAMNASAFGFFRRVLDVSPYYAPVATAPRLVALWMVLAAVVGVATLSIVAFDKTRSSVDRAFGLLLVASQLISPLGWIYYLWLPAGPVAAVAIEDDGARRTWRTALLAVTAAGFLSPAIATIILQPHGWATATIGSAYFWATFALWLWLISATGRSRELTMLPVEG